jgi:hypothetical protein
VALKPSSDCSAIGQKLNFDFQWSYQLLKPKGNPASPLSFRVFTSDSDQSVNYQITLENRENKNQGMAIVILEVDSQCVININDLEAMRLGKVVDFYELKRNNSQVVFYWRGLSCQEQKTFSLALLKKHKVSGSANLNHCAYLYYSKEESITFA